MPKLSMEIEPVEEQGLPVDSYLQKPTLPSSKEKPPKKKRVMSEKQLANLAKAREKSALNRKLKKEQKVAEKEALKEQKKLAKKKGKTPIASTTDYQNQLEPVAEVEEEEYVEEQNDYGTQNDYADSGDTGIDYEFIMSNVYGMLKEDAHREREEKLAKQKAEEEYILKKNAYDETIRADERARLKGVVEEKQKHKKTISPMVNGTDWDSCFQPRGRGGDNFF